MRFDIMTLFPELVERVLGESIIGRAQEAGYTVVKAHNIRDYSEDKHRRVDDTPYGGGKGMLMAAPPIYNCYRGVLADQLKDGYDGRRRVIYLSPGGRVLTQSIAEELAKNYDNLILLCGHYEGVIAASWRRSWTRRSPSETTCSRAARSPPAFWWTAWPDSPRACWPLPNATRTRAFPRGFWNTPSTRDPWTTTA